MQEIEIDEAIRRDPDLLSAVERATRWLEEEIGPSAGSVSARWKRGESNKHAPMVHLKIWETTAWADAQFPAAKFPDLTESSLRLAFVRLWGDLLQVRWHQQSERLKLMIQASV